MKTLVPITNQYEVPTGPSSRETEFEVQAALFISLKAAGIAVRGEIKWCGRASKDARRETCRFDLVIYELGRAVHIIEVKAAPMQHKDGVEATRQGQRYRRFGVPVTFVYGSDDAAGFLSFWLNRTERIAA